MESKDEFKKKNDIENRTCYYVDYTMEIIDINFQIYFVRRKKKEENISNYIISYKATFMGSIPLRIRFNEINGFIKIYDGIRYSLLFTICMMKFEIGLNIL